MTHHDDARLDDLLAHLGDGDSKDLFRRRRRRSLGERRERVRWGTPETGSGCRRRRGRGVAGEDL